MIAGLDQNGESLLLDQSAHGEDVSRKAVLRPSGVEEREVDTVVVPDDFALQPRDTAPDPQERLAIEVAHRDDERGETHLHAQDLLIDLLVVDVLGVRGEAVGDPEERAREHRHMAGTGREVGMQAAEASLDEAGELDSEAHVAFREEALGEVVPFRDALRQ